MNYLLFICFLCLYSNVFADSDPEVDLVKGKLQGKFMKTRQGRIFNAFLGIPYAKPPINELRFKDPEPVESWTGTFKAVKDGPICLQRNPFVRSIYYEGQEDCLYLNVFTPQLAQENKDPLPVMVYFHGGGWICGAGTSDWYGPEILLDQDVVLVIPNYRLGPFGFLSTQDEEVPGNMGLKDQVLVLKWVQENIASFGGDPNSVTIFGESAGGASVHLHLLSPLTKGLVHRGIAQSGTVLGSWGISPGNLNRRNTEKLAKAFGCPTDTSKKMIDCLRKVDGMEITRQDHIFWEWDFDPMIPFKPVIEYDNPNAFLTAHPRQIIKEGRAHPVPWITGITSDEGALRTAALHGQPELLNDFIKDFDRIVPLSAQYDKTAPNIQKVTDKIKEFYFKGKPIGNDSIQDITDLYTDAWFLEGLEESIRLHRKYTGTPVYLYYFAHRGVNSFSEHFGDPTRDYGVCHADELQYLFPVSDLLFPDSPPDDTDKRVTKILTTLWVNFAKTGVPTFHSNELNSFIWNPVRSVKNEFLNIKSDVDMKMDENLLSERAKFWATLPTNSDKADELNKISDEL